MTEISLNETCDMCYDKFPNNTECEICHFIMCKKCYGDYVCIGHEITCIAICSKCNKHGCRKCISACHECLNWGEDTPSYCNECLIYELEETCDLHKWMICNKHDIRCGMCDANRNYDQKHSIL